MKSDYLIRRWWPPCFSLLDGSAHVRCTFTCASRPKSYKQNFSSLLYQHAIPEFKLFLLVMISNFFIHGRLPLIHRHAKLWRRTAAVGVLFRVYFLELTLSYWVPERSVWKLLCGAIDFILAWCYYYSQWTRMHNTDNQEKQTDGRTGRPSGGLCE